MNTAQDWEKKRNEAGRLTPKDWVVIVGMLCLCVAAFTRGMWMGLFITIPTALLLGFLAVIKLADRLQSR